MKHILLLGAGRSATVLINYLIKLCSDNCWSLTIADAFVAQLNIPKKPYVQIISFSIDQNELLEKEVKAADVVISMLPVLFHLVVAHACLKLQKHLVTASYISPEIKALDKEVKQAGLLFLMECGLDPGIDHLSAMAIIHRIQRAGGNISSFKSYTGGLIGPESDTNPWHYKFTWNPRNVVLAGQGTAKYLENGNYKYIPYHQLFRRIEKISVATLGVFEGYANRDSLVYQQAYGLDKIATMVRGTLRRAGYCEAWDILIQLGLTDDSYCLGNSPDFTYRQFIQSYLPAKIANQNWVTQISALLNIPDNSPALEKLTWLEFPEESIGLENATPAKILEKLLMQKWQLAPTDKDMVVMQHIFEYTLHKKAKRITSSLVLMGADSTSTAMATTVGLPVGIAVKLILQNKITQTGVIIPTQPEMYEPILAELKNFGITFTEEEQDI